MYYYSREQQIAYEKKCKSAPPGDDCIRSLTDDNGDVCPMQTHIKTHTRAKQTRTHRTFSYTHTQTHARMRASVRSRVHTHTHTYTHRHTHAHKDTHRHSYTIIFIYRMKCLTFYSLKLLKTHTNCVCEFKKPKVFLKIIIHNVTFKTQSSNFLIF